MPVDFQRVQSLFQAVAALPPAERAAVLERECAGDAELRRCVEPLLQAHDDSGELPAANPEWTGAYVPAVEPGQVIAGRYKLRQKLGEGGMGVVFVADQTEPVQRRVALKIIRAGLDTHRLLARFEQERQALALMDHPNIAKVFDAGMDPAGRPYFAMELVKGLPLTKYCDDARLSPRQRLELFIPVCQAVQHAHHKGIIHRDLKPSNILVGLYDGRPVPKVIDFGVAKATGPRLTPQSVYTEVGSLIGTLEYMSPEQAELNNLDIDTRSDIYALGVILYELLTGAVPLSRKELEKADLAEMLRVIKEVEPPRPSTKLSHSDALPSIAAQRQMEPRKLTALVRGELDWIVMKALEKDRNRRYETANDFALDVQRYLADEPVLACPPSVGYRFRKFARRNRGRLAAAAVLTVALLVAVGGVGWAARDRQARQARLTGQLALILEDVDRLGREQKWPEAQAAAERAAAVLEGGGPDDAIRQRVGDVRRDLAFIARLDRIRQERATIVEGNWNNAGAARAYARAFREYGVDIEALPGEEAVARLRRKPALAAPLAAALDDWVQARRLLGEGEPRWRPLIAVARGLDPDALRDRLRATWGRRVTPKLQADLLRLADSIDARTQGPATLLALAWTLQRAQLGDRALQMLRDGQSFYPGDFWLSLELGGTSDARKDHADAVRYHSVAVSLRPESSAAHNNLGNALLHQGQLDDAVAEYRKAIALDPKFAAAHYNLGGALHDQKKLGEAVGAYHTALELDPKNGYVHNNLGNALRDQGKLAEAVAEFHKALALLPKFAVALVHTNLGNALHDQGKLYDAVAEYRKAIALDPKSAKAHNGLGNALRDQGKLYDAVAEHRKAIALDPKFAAAHSNLGLALYYQKKPAEAVAEYRKAIALDPKYASPHNNLGVVLYDQKKLDEAVAEFRKAIALDPKYAEAHANLGNALSLQRKLDDAVAEYRKAIALDPKYAKAHNGLGGALYQQGKLYDAVAEYRKAIALDPKFARAHNGLGMALGLQGKLDEAVAEFRKAIALDPKFARAHNGLGAALFLQGKLDEAVVPCRKAIALDPEYPAFHYNLSQILQGRGEFVEALQELRRARELGPRDPRWPLPSVERVRECERLVALDAMLPGVLKGEVQPANGGERLELARFCQLPCKALHAAAARFYTGAFAEQPKLADDLRNQLRYSAACAAALAGCGQGKDAGPSSDKARVGLRRQALEWLRADLAAYRRDLEKMPDQVGPAISQRMQRWEQNPDFAGVRGNEALAKLPEAERTQWQKLWQEVAELRKLDAAFLHFYRGLHRGGLTRWPEAETEYRQAIRLRPTWYEPHYQLAVALWEQGRQKDAQAAFRQALRRKPKQPAGPPHAPLATDWSDLENWVVKDQELHQLDEKRAYQLLFGDPAWTDYDFEADVEIVAGGSEVGLILRATGRDDYLYAVVGGWGNTGHAILIKSKTGSLGIGFVKGQSKKGCWYRLRVEARGKRVKMFLDGKLLMTVEAGERRRGCVGLLTNPAHARFRNLRVTDATGNVLLEGVQNVLPRRKD
jgi:tetratricopeptide (TPR) repeat protein